MLVLQPTSRSRVIATSRAGLRRSVVFGAIAVIMGCNDVIAQDADLPDSAAQTQESGIISYSPDFFSASRPTNALDMVQRIPGFSFSAGNNNVRGFAGSGGMSW